MKVVKQRKDGVVQRYNESAPTRFHYDAGHGWLEVPLSAVREAGVADKISSYSYLRGTTAYLEEDRDAPLYLDAIGKSASSFEEVNDGDNSRIRNYPPYPSSQKKNSDEDFIDAMIADGVDEGDIIYEIEKRLGVTTSDAQGILEAHGGA